jgi:transcriptional regulator with XRE-family HTH domain
MVTKREPHPTDVHVGSRLRLRRSTLGMSQEKLAAALGITFQQVQKYEKGANRISSSRLQHMARVLNVPISFFFEEAPGTLADEPIQAAQPAWASALFEFLSSDEGIELNRAFVRIPDAKLRRTFLDLVQAAAAGQDLAV